MKIPKIENLNTPDYLERALDLEHNPEMLKAAKIRRDVYLGLFVVGFICIFITGLLNKLTLCVLSLFLATISLVVMTKYDTQLCFLRILKERSERDFTQDYSQAD